MYTLCSVHFRADACNRANHHHHCAHLYHLFLTCDLSRITLGANRNLCAFKRTERAKPILLVYLHVYLITTSTCDITWMCCFGSWFAISHHPYFQKRSNLQCKFQSPPLHVFIAFSQLGILAQISSKDCQVDRFALICSTLHLLVLRVSCKLGFWN